jgi:hypothetical protein
MDSQLNLIGLFQIDDDQNFFFLLFDSDKQGMRGNEKATILLHVHDTDGAVQS